MKHSISQAVLTAVCMLLSIQAAFCAGKLQIQGSLPTEIGLYEKLEISLLYEGSFHDPYDPKEIRLDASIVLPSGKTISYPGFFDHQQDAGTSSWAIRFSPFEVGVHTIQLQIQDAEGSYKTEEYSIQVKESGANGFLHLPTNEKAAYTYEFDSKKPFRGIGMNFGWEARHNIDTIYTLENYTYKSFLGEMKGLGMNFFRTWMCPWNLPLEWNKVDSHWYQNEDQYRFNQSAIRKMDELLNYAAEEDMYFMLALDYHGALKTEEDYFGGNNYWLQHPYNQINGGPCKDPVDFFTNEEAKERYKNRLRFMMARWGYSPNIAVFEFWNEIDNATEGEKIPVEVVVEWHREMAAYFKRIDPYQHMLSTSTSHRPVAGLFDVEGIDFSQTHMYGHTDQMEQAISSKLAEHLKPTLIGEIGYDWRTPEPHQVNLFKDDLKLSLWRGLFSQVPVLPMTWWWEFLYEHEGLGVFKAVSAFSAHMLADASPGLEAVVAKGSEGMEVKALRSGSGVYAWVNNAAKQGKEFELVLNTGIDKKAKCYWINTETGAKSRLKGARVKKGGITLKCDDGSMPDMFALIIE